MDQKIYSKTKSFSLKLILLVTLMTLGGSSAWGDELTVYESSSKYMYVPFQSGGILSGYGNGQLIIPSTELGSMNGGTINSITFYSDATTFNSAEFEIYMDEVSYTVFESTTFNWDGMTLVYSGGLTNIVDGKVVISTTGYTYNGGNLRIGVKQTKNATATPSTVYWAGVPSGTNSALINYTYSSSATYRQYLPKITFAYEVTGCPNPSGLSITDITYNSASLSWTSSADAWQVYYSTTEGEPAEDSEDIYDVNTTSYSLTALSDYTTYYVYVRTKCSEDSKSDWVGTSFTTAEQYPKPTDFAVSETDATTASFTWTNGGAEDSWQIAYSTDSSFSPDTEGTKVTVSENPYTLEGLTTGTTYYAYIRANYSGNYSRWSNLVEFMPTNEIIVNEGSKTSRPGPFHGTYITQTTNKGQIIIPATDLSSITNRQITSLTFFTQETSLEWGAKFDVYLKETTKTTYSYGETMDTSYGTKVLENASFTSDSDGKMVVYLSTPFNYTSNSLMITFNLVETANSGVTTNWLGLYTYQSAYYYYSGSSYSNGRSYFAPQTAIASIPITTANVKIGATGYTTFCSAWPLNLDDLPDGLTAYYAASDAVQESTIKLTEATGNVPAGTGLLLKGTAGTTYAIPVADSGTALEGNLLVGVPTLEETLSTNASYYVMVNNGGTAQFQCLDQNGATIPGGKAYLNTGAAGARNLTFVFDNEEGGTTTGIAYNNNETKANGCYYNLLGQKVKSPRKGLYILNGKKMMK